MGRRQKTFDFSKTYIETRNVLESKYYSMYLSKFKIKGLDYRQEDYFLRKMWSAGTLAIFKLKSIDEPVLCPYTTFEYDIYDQPDKIQFVNLRGSSVIPAAIQTVDKDCVIGYANKAHKPVRMVVSWYLDRIAQAEMVVNTNLQLQKIPFLIPVDEQNQHRLEDIVQKILSNEIVIWANVDDPQLIKALSTNAPYIIDKLNEYKYGLENQLKTYLGIDNQGGYLNREQQNLDTTCSNDVEINLNNDSLLDSLKEFLDRANETLGLQLGIELKHQKAMAIGESKDDQNLLHDEQR